MNSLHVLPIQSQSFVLLVKQMKLFVNKADIFEIWLDQMKVKGDLAVIQTYFQKPMIAKSSNLDLLKKGAKSGFHYVDAPHDLRLDLEFKTLIKNKGTKLIKSYHNFSHTPSEFELLRIIKEMDIGGADLIKLATMIQSDDDTMRLLDLLKLPKYKNRLIITGMGDLSRQIRIMAPVHGSVFYYAPILPGMESAPGQITREELENEWKLI